MLDAIIGAVGDIAGGMLTNTANKKQASRQMRFQEIMSNTAHQREVNDLRAAGLNPILSATGGHGASTPSGVSAPMTDFSQMGTRVANSVRASRELSKTLESIDANIAKTKQDTQTSYEIGEKALADSRYVNDQRVLIDETIKQNKMRSALMSAQLPYQLEKAKLTEDSKEFLKYERFLEPFLKILGMGNSAKSLFSD